VRERIGSASNAALRRPRLISTSHAADVERSRPERRIELLLQRVQREFPGSTGAIQAQVLAAHGSDALSWMTHW
jgi:hypothetical protein